MKTVLIIDGQGGRIGSALAERLLAAGCPCTLMAIGANSMATSAMMKAGVRQCATGENPVAVMAPRADIIAGPAGILAANAMMGEITPRMALAVTESAAKKILVPMNRCGIQMAGVEDLPLSEYIARAAALIDAACREG